MKVAAAERPERRAGPTPELRWFLYFLGAAFFVVVVLVRGGPSTGDAYAVVNPTTELSHGDLGAAAAAQTQYQPPGYSVLASPFVATFRPLIGPSTWCDDHVPALERALEPQCAPNRIAGQRWYRSQALLGILAWMVLAAGCADLLRAAGLGHGFAPPLTVMALALLPAASATLVQTFHPQDLVCVGLLCMAMGQALRRRWVLTGVLFALALTCKQFAVLALIPVLAAAPTWRERVRVLVPAGVVFAAVMAPFYVVNHTATLTVLEAVSTGGGSKISAGTIVGLAPLSESSKLVLARLGAMALALLISMGARRALHKDLLSPVPLIGLALAGLASRLVFEVWIYGYYLLAVGAVLFVLDVACRRPPIRSIAWIAVTTAVVENLTHIPQSAAAVMWLVASFTAIGIGAAAFTRRDPGATALI